MPRFGILASLVSIAIVAGLIWVLEPETVVSAFSEIPLSLVLAALVIVQLQIILSAFRWRFTAARLGHLMPPGLVLREYYASSLLNQVLPGGMAGDAIRAYRAREDGSGGWKRPATAVVFERLSGQLAFFVLMGIGLIAWPVLVTTRLPEHYLSLIAVFLAIAVLLVLMGLLVWKTRVSERLEQLKPDLVRVFWADKACVIQAGLSSLIVGGYVATFMIASHAVGAPLPWIAALTAIPLCLLTMLIPAGIGGWGTREAAAAALWPIFGYSSAEGLSASLLYGLLSLAGAALPGIIVIAHSLWRGRILRA
ncbi:flippase-like domain-containing protein (plasmid) [Peteryoungia desertarenae]|uniref:Flippase-like domain-containing protein n=1 Tax=Peteryoungia desertarenae TaxID=1813451 RepID=A0ABX6QTZ9_9HYPH|nr:lysylphosphatidylglycerol synthase transmembrane domain-containing protein [Peteryoungia desertarenae]QLF71665.1 flippase-like domain-containing protein [Peteryoungia desertarenae]